LDKAVFSQLEAELNAIETRYRIELAKCIKFMREMKCFSEPRHQNILKHACYLLRRSRRPSVKSYREAAGFFYDVISTMNHT
jgi:hypothetical protein